MLLCSKRKFQIQSKMHLAQSLRAIRLVTYIFFLFCSVLQDEDDIIPDLSEDESAILRMEDCEAFKCEVVSFGRQAYDLVAKSLLEEDIEKNK